MVNSPYDWTGLLVLAVFLAIAALAAHMAIHQAILPGFGT